MARKAEDLIRGRSIFGDSASPEEQIQGITKRTYLTDSIAQKLKEFGATHPGMELGSDIGKGTIDAAATGGGAKVATQVGPQVLKQAIPRLQRFADTGAVSAITGTAAAGAGGESLPEAIKTGAVNQTLSIDDIYAAIEKRVIGVCRPDPAGVR